MYKSPSDEHIGGMLRAIRLINAARSTNNSSKVTVDLHPDRPDFRGVTMPIMQMSLEADPSFAEIEDAGGIVSKNAETHTVCDDFFLISGEIPRVTEYEYGLRRGARYSIEKGVWEKDEKMEDERFVMCNVKGMFFSSCHHADHANFRVRQGYHNVHRL
jgi:7,8-dihydropterin-6-yl-methyl-4-(beta-D-ribofuranosyl)aminobenzene 5'-phosphate synthase